MSSDGCSIVETYEAATLFFRFGILLNTQRAEQQRGANSFEKIFDSISTDSPAQRYIDIDIPIDPGRNFRVMLL